MTADGASSAVLRYLRRASGTKTEAEILREPAGLTRLSRGRCCSLRRLQDGRERTDYKRNLRYLRVSGGQMKNNEE